MDGGGVEAVITHLARRRERRMRDRILRGLFEENLVILGRRRPAAHHGPSRGAKAGVFAATFAGLTFFASAPLAPEFFDAARIQARSFAPAPEAALAPETAPGIDPALFQGGRDLPLRHLLGLGVKTILVDPGHGGEDTGAIGRGGTLEKELALDISRRLKRRLEAVGGFQVLLTRDGDRTVPLEERVAISQAVGADLFISVHLNFLPSKPINIIETFYFGPASDAAAAASARRENSGGGPGMSELREIVERMGTRMRLEESRELAAAIQSSLYRNSRRRDAAVLDHGIKRGPFVVLNRAEVPAVLAEVACLSNAAEEKRLESPEHREDIAAYLETGILDYLRNGEGTYESKK